MHKSIFALSLFVLFSLSIASNSSKNENYHENYKNQTLKEKINQMRVLGLDEASSSKQSNAQPIKKGLMIKSKIDVVRKAEMIGKEPMIPSNGRDECEEGYVDDCSGDGDCCPESWIGDGLCDGADSQWGCDMTCYENDGGDCAEEDDGGDDGGDSTDDGGTGGDGGEEGCADDEFDCLGDGTECIPASYECDVYWVDCSNGADEADCEGNDDAGTGGDFECSELGYEECLYYDFCEWISDSDVDPGFGGICVDFGTGDDGGDEECDDSEVEDCSGDGDCCPAGWIGDGYADCEDQPWGCDLSCYENDGGDCEENNDDGGDFECSDLGYDDCVYYDFCEWISSDNVPSGGECVDAGTGDDGGDDEVQVTLILGDGIVIPGGETQISLSLESVEPVAGIQFTLNSSPEGIASVYDLLTSVSEEDCFEANFSNTENGETIGLIYSLSGCLFEPSEENIEIATLSLEVNSDAIWGSEIELYFEETIVAGDGGVELNSSSYGGILSVGMIGDVNHDGDINVVDAVSMISFILQTADPLESQVWAADINGDGSLNILDVVLLVEMILG